MPGTDTSELDERHRRGHCLAKLLGRCLAKKGDEPEARRQRRNGEFFAGSPRPMTVAASAKHASAMACKARAEKRTVTERQQRRQSSAVVSHAWNNMCGLQRERLDPDCNLAERVPGRDGRTWAEGKILQTVFTTTLSGNIASSAGLFDTETSSGTQVECHIAVADTSLEVQKNNVMGYNEDQEVARDWAAVHWEGDCTPQDVGIQDADTRAILDAARTDQQAKRGTRDVFVSHGHFRASAGNGTRTISEDLLAAPVVMGDQFSKTVLVAFMQSLEQSGLKVKTLSALYPIVFLLPGYDGAPANSLTLDYVEEKLDFNVIVVKALCQCHGVSRGVGDHLTKGGMDLHNPFYGMSTGLRSLEN